MNFRSMNAFRRSTELRVPNEVPESASQNQIWPRSQAPDQGQLGSTERVCPLCLFQVLTLPALPFFSPDLIKLEILIARSTQDEAVINVQNTLANYTIGMGLVVWLTSDVVIAPFNWVERHYSCQLCGMFYEPQPLFFPQSLGTHGLALATTVLFSDVIGW